MNVTLDRGRVAGSTIWGRLIGCAAAIGLLIAATAPTFADESGDTQPSQQLAAPGGETTGGLHAAGPVVTAAPQRDPQPLSSPDAPSANDFGGSAPPAPIEPTPAIKRRKKPLIIDAHDANAPQPKDDHAPVEAAPSVEPSPAHDSVPTHDPGPAPEAGATAEPLTFKGIEELPPLPELAVNPSSFKGIKPGESTSDDLSKLWGDGTTVNKGGAEHRLYNNIPPYRRIDVTMEGHKVASLAVQLEKPFEADALTRQLHLEGVVPVPVLDEAGQELGLSFPERGILFGFAPETKLATQVLIESIDAEPFVMRAAATADLQIRSSLRDLDYALQLEPKAARVHALRAQLLSHVGRYDDALAAIESALRLEPKQPSFLLGKAEILEHLNQSANAIDVAKEALAPKGVSPLVRAQTLNLLGDLTADGPEHDYKQAIELHLSAIKMAQPLYTDHRTGVRRQAKRLLVEAHLGAAGDVANGVWQQKEQTTARWLLKADELAKDLIQNEAADPELRLYLARRALDDRVAVEGKWDLSDWTAYAIQDGETLMKAADDPLRRQQIQWELGRALFDLAELDQLAGFNDRSLTDSKLTLEQLTEGAKHRQQTDEDAYLFGRLYAHIGVIQATHEKNHVEAVAWFDKALPLLDRPLPPSANMNLGRHGESFVAMGISYWQTGRRDDGLRLTQRGVELMTQAVAAKQLDEKALAIPYGNLATMHRQLGHTDEARSFEETAARYGGATKR